MNAIKLILLSLCVVLFQVVGLETTTVSGNELGTNRVLDGLTRALSFYEAHLNQLSKRNTALALIVLKGIDDKHGKILQEKYPLEKWVQGLCDSSNKVNRASGHFCWTLNRYWKNRSGNKSNPNYWRMLNQTIGENYEENIIGSEKHADWEARIVHQCEMSLVNRCKVPYVCRTILLDRKPRSQYLLTHQLLYRVFIESMDCPVTKSLVTVENNEEIYENLCAKMFSEAEYLDGLNVPVDQRDLFAELVGFCGHMGYTTFLREDWLERILSWQSSSDYGCFVKDRLSTDVGLKRQATLKEMEDFGINYRPSEKCSPHLTAVGLVALSAYWDFLLDTLT